MNYERHPGKPAVKVSHVHESRLSHPNPAIRFNTWLGMKITNGVSTMWCAYAFASLALVSLPAAIASHSIITEVSWLAQTFLQLVLLSVIMVGQDVLGKSGELRSEQTEGNTEAILHAQEHAIAQNDLILARLGIPGKTFPPGDLTGGAG